MQIGVTTTIANRSRSGVVADSMQIDVTTTRGTSSDTAPHPEHTRQRAATNAANGHNPDISTDFRFAACKVCANRAEDMCVTCMVTGHRCLFFCHNLTVRHAGG